MVSQTDEQVDMRGSSNALPGRRLLDCSDPGYRLASCEDIRLRHSRLAALLVLVQLVLGRGLQSRPVRNGAQRERIQRSKGERRDWQK